MLENELREVKKVWGSEFIVSPTEGYTVKIMSVLPNAACSTHFHRHKYETFTLVQGELWVICFSPDGSKGLTKLSTQLTSISIPPCTPHTFMVPPEQEVSTLFIESSTRDDPADSYRLTRSTSNVTEDPGDWGFHFRSDLPR
jgi:mannose-6-phosphate isomerase-like protein (cupin superfamily)